VINKVGEKEWLEMTDMADDLANDLLEVEIDEVEIIIILPMIQRLLQGQFHILQTHGLIDL
jgi:hypothetical protein